MRLLNIEHRARLLLALSAIAIAAAGIITLIGFRTARHSLEEESFNKLTAVREMKARQIEDYLSQIRSQIITFSEDRMVIDAMKAFGDAFRQIEIEYDGEDDEWEALDAANRSYYVNEFLPRLNRNQSKPTALPEVWPEPRATRLLQHLYVAEESNPNATGAKDLLNDAGDGSTYSQVHRLYHPIFRKYLNEFGYYDIFLVDAETGHIVYTVFKEVDYGTSLLAGPYMDTNFADAFRAARDADSHDFSLLVDFESYTPSYNAPAAFVASPIYDGAERLGVLVFQMPIDRINDVMTNNYGWSDVGLGKSGETYLVGDDYLLRNQSRFLIEDRENYFALIRRIGLPQDTINRIRNLDTTISLQPVKTEGTTAAIGGETGTKIFPDYRGVSVLSSYKPLALTDVHWAIMSEIDEVEAFNRVYKLRNQTALWFGLLIVVVVSASVLFSKTLGRAQKELMEQKTLLENTIESLPHPFYVVDATDLSFKVANTAARRLGATGAVTYDAFTHKPKTPSDLPEDPKPLEEVKRTRQAFVCEQVRRDAEGEQVFAEVHGYPIFDEHGSVVQVIEYSLDISERKRAEQELRKAYQIIESQKERMEEELNVGREIQMSMVPLIFPAFPEYDEFKVWGALQPARELGGDFYDFFFIDKDRFCFCIGDVSGKGVPSALFMAVARAFVKLTSEHEFSPAHILSIVNQELSRGNTSAMFVTLLLGILDIKTGKLVYSNGGHNPPYLLRASEGLSRLEERHGAAVRVLPGLTYKETTIMLSPGDVLFMYTDGVTEALDREGNFFTEARLADILRVQKSVLSRNIVETVLVEVDRFAQGAEQADDITTLCVEFNGPKDGMDHILALSMRNLASEMNGVQERFAAFASEHAIPESDVQRIGVVLDELLSNVISYGYSDDLEHTIEIKFESLAEELVITIEDDGIPFNPFSTEPPDTSLPLEDRPIGGVGIHLVRNVMDRFHYERRAHRNIVTLKKRTGV